MEFRGFATPDSSVPSMPDRINFERNLKPALAALFAPAEIKVPLRVLVGCAWSRSLSHVVSYL